MIDLNDAGPQFIDQRADRPRCAERRAAAHRARLGAKAVPERPQGRRCAAPRQYPRRRAAQEWAPASSTSKARTPATGSTSTAMSVVGRCRRCRRGHSSKAGPFWSLACGVRRLLARDSATRPATSTGATRKAPEGAAEREISFILSRALPLAGTHAEAYLRGRGLDTAGAQDLLFHPDLAHFQTRAGYPALVAIVRDQAGEPVGVHRIWLDPAAPTKAALDNPKKSVGLDPRRRDPTVSCHHLRGAHRGHRDGARDPHRAPRPASLGRDRGRASRRMPAAGRHQGDPGRGRS